MLLSYALDALDNSLNKLFTQVWFLPLKCLPTIYCLQFNAVGCPFHGTVLCFCWSNNSTKKYLNLFYTKKQQYANEIFAHLLKVKDWASFLCISWTTKGTVLKFCMEVDLKSFLIPWKQHLKAVLLVVPRQQHDSLFAYPSNSGNMV